MFFFASVEGSRRATGKFHLGIPVSHAFFSSGWQDRTLRKRPSVFLRKVKGKGQNKVYRVTSFPVGHQAFLWFSHVVTCWGFARAVSLGDSSKGTGHLAL
jgi:hypothetical protein